MCKLLLTGFQQVVWWVKFWNNKKKTEPLIHQACFKIIPIDSWCLGHVISVSTQRNDVAPTLIRHGLTVCLLGYLSRPHKFTTCEYSHQPVFTTVLLKKRQFSSGVGKNHKRWIDLWMYVIEYWSHHPQHTHTKQSVIKMEWNDWC